MRGLDYKAIEALDAVLTTGSFERAAAKLFLSQSAVSQRIKQLEKFVAQPVLVRELPPRPTEIGKKLMGLYRRVQLMENELLPNLLNQESQMPMSVAIASNADSLATWLLPALESVMKQRNVEMSIYVDAEDRTIEKVKSGEVAGAVSSGAKPVSGCAADYLGRMDYVCVASPAFCQRYFADGVDTQSLNKAPSVSFNQYDNMHQQFLSQFFGLEDGGLRHQVASSEAFVKLALSGVAYCLMPKLQIEQELAQKTLINITPEYYLSYHIYWHHWQAESGILKEISQAIVDYARAVLEPA
ncbi:LysR family transcriptional regulator ArgP [Vibrio olivae]|uniref:HTH-type transcriptional regulator ArgP n=1 Tax=Vibrio olivae TaxID=1243002 RepID=A0ABV5HP71_9VIBR